MATKLFDNSTKIMSGYLFNDDNKNSNIELDEILRNAQESIMVFDYSNNILNEIISKFYERNHTQDILFAGVTSKENLKVLKDQAASTGFFSDTRIESQGAIIITDNKRAYFAVNEGVIFEILTGAKELFDYINYIIWNKSERQMLGGTIGPVKNLHFSVFKPVFKDIKRENEFDPKIIYACSDNFISTNSIYYVTEPTMEHENSILIKRGIPSLLKYNNRYFINVFEDCYCEIEFDDSIALAQTFNEIPLGKLVGRHVYINGEDYIVQMEKSIEKNVFLPLDEIDKYEPNYRSYIEDDLVNKFVKFEVKINVKPIIIDETYTLSKNYQNRERFSKELRERIQKEINLAGDDVDIVKKLNDIQEETKLIDKVNMYNKYIQNDRKGLEVLKSKKNKTKTLRYDAKNLDVPSELLGKLYTKNNASYFGLTAKTSVEDAKKYLKDSGLNSILALLPKGN